VYSCNSKLPLILNYNLNFKMTQKVTHTCSGIKFWGESYFVQSRWISSARKNCKFIDHGPELGWRKGSRLVAKFRFFIWKIGRLGISYTCTLFLQYWIITCNTRFSFLWFSSLDSKLWEQLKPQRIICEELRRNCGSTMWVDCITGNVQDTLHRVTYNTLSIHIRGTY
jgi:hypothetical protein